MDCIKSVILKEFVKFLSKIREKQPPDDTQLNLKLPDGTTVILTLVFKKKSLKLLKSS